MWVLSFSGSMQAGKRGSRSQRGWQSRSAKSSAVCLRKEYLHRVRGFAPGIPQAILTKLETPQQRTQQVKAFPKRTRPRCIGNTLSPIARGLAAHLPRTRAPNAETSYHNRGSIRKLGCGTGPAVGGGWPDGGCFLVFTKYTTSTNGSRRQL